MTRAAKAVALGPDSDIPDKLYFKIGEVADLVGVQAHVLRYWEKEVAAIRPTKSASNQRRYRRKDVEIFREIRRMRAEPLTADVAERLKVPYTRGLVVVDVAAGSPAEAAGLRRGDVILEVARQPVSDAADLRRALGALPQGESALLYVHRPGGEGRNQYLVLERGAAP